MSKVFSTEDGNLSTSIRVVKDRLYSDIDLSLSARTTEFGYDANDDGDILRKKDAAAVRQSIKNLLLTNESEKPYLPKYGGNLGSLLFENMDENTGQEIIDRVETAIALYEPRAKVRKVRVFANPNVNSVSVVVEFRVVQTGFVDTLKVRLNEPAAEIAFAPPVTPAATFDEILLAENEFRLLTEDGSLIGYDNVTFGILTQAEEPLLTQDGLILENN